MRSEIIKSGIKGFEPFEIKIKIETKAEAIALFVNTMFDVRRDVKDVVYQSYSTQFKEALDSNYFSEKLLELNEVLREEIQFQKLFPPA